ncbi:SDR family oxidoreductase [Hyphomicrobium sp.]|uniref:SDR family oxidoreductase n=1 Tax=Hyphomicrobium sp. TaxID=82 RepID=UPI002D79C4C5|nr:SDR family oxidoreductase [Hyphomicrobium sp.]HET6388507.1 SDR family oxidoreductase [Hyphomicrobium sp.]
MSRLFCFGLGYCAGALSRRLIPQGWTVAGTTAHADKVERLASEGVEPFFFDGTGALHDVAEAMQGATHVLLSIPPDAQGDPALRHYGDAIAATPSIRWIGYFSTVGVYGDAAGNWVDETSATQPGTERGQRRLQAENGWSDFARKAGKTLVIYRLPGIYGPGRSAIDQLKAGTARRIFKPGQLTNRVHVEDIATAVEASLDHPAGVHIFNVTDDLPAPPQDVIAYGAELLGVPCPPATDPSDADLSPTARSFYIENKKVSNARMKSELGVKLAYPTYIEGLKSIAGL